MKRIVLTGGGTGGHITPLLAVAHEIKRLEPDCHIIYIGERNGKYAQLTENNPNIDETKAIFAGKLRRYHGESWLKRILDVKTNFLNIRDLGYFLLGTLQSLLLIKKLKPDMIMLKGGFVGVPVGLAAALWRLPFVTHDSDAVPGLANRIVGRWATLHATALPAAYYGYNPSQIKHVGVLVGESYVAVDEAQQLNYKDQLGLSSYSKLILITGGSGGAAAINQSVRAIIDDLLAKYPDLAVIHQVGIGKSGIYDDYDNERLKVYELLNPMFAYTGAADVVITRAGANTMAELGVQGKACIVVPNPLLTGGHQLKNAKIWSDNNAAVILDEKALKQDPQILFSAVEELIGNDKKRQELAKNLHDTTIPDAARRMALILIGKDISDEAEA